MSIIKSKSSPLSISTFFASFPILLKHLQYQKLFLSYDQENVENLKFLDDVRKNLIYLHRHPAKNYKQFHVKSNIVFYFLSRHYFYKPNFISKIKCVKSRCQDTIVCIYPNNQENIYSLRFKESVNIFTKLINE